MEGGTTFHFIDATPVEALKVARMPQVGLTCASGEVRQPFVNSSRRI